MNVKMYGVVNTSIHISLNLSKLLKMMRAIYRSDIQVIKYELFIINELEIIENNDYDKKIDITYAILLL